MDQNGRLLDADTTNTHNELVWETIALASRYSKENSASIPVNESLMDYIKKKVHDEAKSDNAEKSIKSEGAIDTTLVHQMAEIWGAFVGGMTETQSLKFLWLEESLEGETLFCAGTYEKVLNVVAKSAVDAEVITFSQSVNKVLSKQRTNDNPKVEVTTKNGWNKEFDEVVFTAPLGWLKRNKGSFEPALPTRISQSIDNLGYGNLDKVSC